MNPAVCEFHGRDEKCVHCLGDEIDRLREAGDKLAQAVQERWSGDGQCDCDCCTAAREWTLRPIVFGHTFRPSGTGCPDCGGWITPGLAHDCSLTGRVNGLHETTAEAIASDERQES